MQEHLGITATSKSVSGLAGGTTYQWRVNASNINGEGSWSTPTRSFTTISNPPSAPALSGTVSNGHPSLSWNSVGSGITYKVYRYSCEGYADCGLIGSLRYTGPNLSWIDINQVVGGPHDPNSIWYYVKATNSGGTSPASNKKSYQIDLPGESGTQVGDVPMDSELPRGNYLSENYPNPFNPTTEIAYSIESDSWVSLKVYAMTGEEVATLVDEYQTGGYRSVEFNASKLPSGIYVYRLLAGSFSAMKKLVLIK